MLQLTYVFDSGLIDSVDEFDSVLNSYSKSLFWKRMKRNKPSRPLTSQAYSPRKIPIFLPQNQQILPYQLHGQRFFYKQCDNHIIIKLSTLRKGQPIELKLQSSAYHNRELSKGKLTDGRLVWNRTARRWEFHATIKIKVGPKKQSVKPTIIISIDLGINTDATVVILEEDKKLSQKGFYFFKEGDLRRRKFNIEQRKKVFQRIISTTTGLQSKKATEELK